MLNDIVKLDQVQWFPHRSDFTQTNLKMQSKRKSIEK